jgi:hypothetical protein
MRAFMIRTAGIVSLGAALTGCYFPQGSHSLSGPSSQSSGFNFGGDTTTTTVAPLPTASEFRVTLTETKRDCFGDAGCNVEYQVKPHYIGSGAIPDGSFKVLYSVSGCENAQNGNIDIRNGHYDTDEGSCSTNSDGAKLTARVTQVVED